VRSDGNTAVDLLEAILPLFPLDTFVESPLTLMSVVPGHDYDPVIWKTFREIVGRHAPDTAFAFVERFAFYEQARQAYAIVATSETALYANIILKKGVIPA
jgi:L-fucose mutarotase